VNVVPQISTFVVQIFHDTRQNLEPRQLLHQLPPSVKPLHDQLPYLVHELYNRYGLLLPDPTIEGLNYVVGDIVTFAGSAKL
jgi:hypothetical protein